MGDALQIVDSIAASPTVLFDLNNESPSGAFDVDLSPPGLRYTTSSSMLVDGSHVSASSYENRTISLGLDFIGASQDAWASSWQTLARLLDQDRFWLKWQPTGATSPVFFRCHRSQVPSIQDMKAAVAYRQASISIPADPGAYGLPVDIASFVITNDTAAGTNRMIVGPSVLGTIKGDLETPLLLAQTAGWGVTTGNAGTGAYALMSSFALSGGLTHSLLARDLTELTSSTDTGATVSGAGTSYLNGNYKQITFATRTGFGTVGVDNPRLHGKFSTTLTPIPGRYRVFLRVVASASTSTVYGFKVGTAPMLSATEMIYGDTVTKDFTGLGTVQLVDCGVIDLPVNVRPEAAGLGSDASTATTPYFGIDVSIVSGTTTALNMDELFLLPIDVNYGTGNLCMFTWPFILTANAEHNAFVFDGANDAMKTVFDASTTSPFTGIPAPSGTFSRAGQLPTVIPGRNNYLQFIMRDLNTVGGTTTWSGRYYPQYLYVRPATT